MRSIPKLAVALGACFGVGAIGGAFTATSVNTWYAQLIKPELSPPNWVFAPVWNVLYFLMALSFYFVLVSESNRYKSAAVKVFMFQLLINAVWSAVFFGAQSPAGGLVVILSLLILIGWTVMLFRRVCAKSAFLLVPYWLWVCFAAYLNYRLWILNRGL